MPELSVCIEMFWRGVPYEERVRRVAAIGFSAFEFWSWENKDLEAIRAVQQETGLAMAAMTLVPGGSLIKRHFQDELLQGMRKTAQAAHRLDCKTIIVTVGNTLDDETFEVSRRRVVRNLKAIAQVAEDEGLTLVLEPLNTLVNHHGYWLTKMSQAADIVQEVDSPAAKILMDIYHQQIQEGQIISNLREYIDEIGHFHTAGVPGRNELVGGELDYRAIFRAIDATGYRGYVGLEYRPLLDPEVSLKQALSLVETDEESLK